MGIDREVALGILHARRVAYRDAVLTHAEAPKGTWTADAAEREVGRQRALYLDAVESFLVADLDIRVARQEADELRREQG